MIDWKSESKQLFFILLIVFIAYHLPLESSRFTGSILEALQLLRWYAREHVLLCLIPAFFIAGAIATFVSKASVMKYLGPQANKLVAYSVASVSGAILAVCSCTVLPLFAGIYLRGAGLGPAIAFLYSGPAINVLAIILTARVLGLELGIARAVGAIVFSVLIGLSMQLLFRNERQETAPTQLLLHEQNESSRPIWQTALYFASMIAILVFANWAQPPSSANPFWQALYAAKWKLTSLSAVALALILVLWLGIRWWQMLLAALPPALLAILIPPKPTLAFVTGVIMLSVITALHRGEPGQWFLNSWMFAKQIIPLLFAGVLAAGFFLGRPGSEGIIPSSWVSSAVGGNGLFPTFIASISGAFMYFATLTEVPILQGLMANGMGKGPALALLLAGPAVSLPSMLVLRTIMGAKKTVAYILLVVCFSTLVGFLYGQLFD